MKQIIIVLLIAVTAGCASKQEDTSTADSTALQAAVPTGTTPVKAPPALTFTDNDLFTKLLPFDPNDPNGFAEWFPDDDGDCEGLDNEDETPWYRLCAYNNGSMAVTYYDFFDNEPQRFYFYEISCTDPKAEFAKGIHVGMTREEFIGAVNLTDPAAASSAEIRALQNPGKHSIDYRFADDKLQSLTINFNYDSIPSTISDFDLNWTEVYLNEAEGMVETWIVCNPKSFVLEEITVADGPKEITKWLMTIGSGMVAETRTDTVEWIRKSGDGLLIRAYNASSEGSYLTNVSFKDYTWDVAVWNGVLLGSSRFVQYAYTEKCDEEDPD